QYEGEHCDIGSDRYLRTGELLTDEDIDFLKKKDAIYFGAIGDPRVKPGILEGGILLKMRAVFDQYINLRPVTSWFPLVPLKREVDFDIHFLRENTEDFYMGLGKRFGPSYSDKKNADGSYDVELGVKREAYNMDFKVNAHPTADDDYSIEIGLVSRKGITRWADYVMKYALARGDKKVTLVDKANVITNNYGMQREIFQEKAKEYGLDLEYMFVDAMSMAMIVRPETFGTVAVPNLFGDILTDLGAQLQGGLGMGGSGNINPNGVSMFEPIHGSAPDIAGQGKANPIAAVLAAQMLLENQGFPSVGRMLHDAVRHCLDNKLTTPDLGGTLKTAEVGKEIAKYILNQKK
ncbi:MAG: isocitrate/isopropylmalate family dehydrogenase, partial [archaeon]|nr:isocitrate/isopropylmalate family dehydrogenase [archaeon]